jgi:hypothetical protein
MSVGHGLPKKTTFSYNLFFNCPGSDLNEVGDGLIGLLVFKELPAELGALKCNEGVAEDQFIEMQVVGGASCRYRRPFCATGDRMVALRVVEGPFLKSSARSMICKRSI